jgi:hypothetical protein
MSKFTITRIWIAGLIALAAGLIVGGAGLGLLLAYGGHFAPALSGSGYDFIPTINGYFWAMISLMVVGFTVAAAGGVTQLAAWIGALVNTYQLADKAWFIVLVATGLLGLGFGLVGFAGMVAYVIAGPNGMPVEQPRTPLTPPQSTSLVAAH